MVLARQSLMVAAVELGEDFGITLTGGRARRKVDRLAAELGGEALGKIRAE